MKRMLIGFFVVMLVVVSGCGSGKTITPTPEPTPEDIRVDREFVVNDSALGGTIVPGPVHVRQYNKDITIECEIFNNNEKAASIIGVEFMLYNGNGQLLVSNRVMTGEMRTESGASVKCLANCILGDHVEDIEVAEVRLTITAMAYTI